MITERGRLLNGAMTSIKVSKTMLLSRRSMPKVHSRGVPKRKQGAAEARATSNGKKCEQSQEESLR